MVIPQRGVEFGHILPFNAGRKSYNMDNMTVHIKLNNERTIHIYSARLRFDECIQSGYTSRIYMPVMSIATNSKRRKAGI